MVPRDLLVPRLQVESEHGQMRFLVNENLKFLGIPLQHWHTNYLIQLFLRKNRLSTKGES